MQTCNIPRGLGGKSLGQRSSLRCLPIRSKVAPRVICQAGTEPAEDAASVTAPVMPMVPEAVYQPQDPRLMAQGAARQQQEFYMAPPPPGYYYPPYRPAVEEPAPSSGAPWWIWLGAGFIGAQVFNKVQEFVKNPKTPQQMMAEMAMKQMMSAMGNQGGAPGGMPGGMPGMPGMPPGFGAAGASPFGAAGASPFGAAGATPGFGAAAARTVDVSPSTPASSASNGSERRGEKFSARTGSSSSAASSTTAAPTETKGIDVVEPTTVKEPTGSATGGGSSKGFFTDVSDSSKSAASNPFAAAEQQARASSSGSAAGSSGADGSSSMSSMMEQMLRNPDMQKMLYPYLPEGMRNPASIEFMLNNPEVKKQMEAMFEQQNMSPQMLEMLKNTDFSQEKVNKQFSELGLKPDEVISKVMANPELAAGFSNPKVQAAIMDISSNPMNIMKYQSDPEIMKVLETVTTIFQPSVPPNMRT